MNNQKGQVLILVIVLLPIIILAMGMLIELSLIGYYNARLNSVTKMVISMEIDTKNIKAIKELYEKNDIEVTKLEVTTEKDLQIEVSTEIDSFLGTLINRDKYTISTNLIGSKENDQVIYKKG